MVQPIQYLPAPVDPFTRLAEGLVIGQEIGQISAQRQQAEQAAQLQQQYSVDLEEAFNVGTPAAFAKLTAKYPQQREAFKQSFDLLSTDQQNNEFMAGAQAFNAIKSGNIDAAKQLLETRIEAARNSGMDTSKLEMMRSGLDANPEFVANTLGMTLSAIDPERWSKMATEFRAQVKFPVEIAEMESVIQNRANTYNLDVDKFVSEQQAKVADLTSKGTAAPSLSANSEKTLNESAMKAVVAESTAGKMRDLANRFKTLAPTAGVLGAYQESLASVFGTQDPETELRKEYIRLRNASVMQNLPPGVASDKDIELAMSGYLPENADPETIASFLEGVAKMNDVDAAQNNATAEWISEVGNLGKARSDIEIGGIKVAKGTTFSDFSRKYVDQFALRQRREGEETKAGGRSYMKYATGR
jgi:hypothetical protein